MRHLFLYILITALTTSAGAQQLIKANNVQLVSTPGIQLVTAGGITFTGTTSFQHNGRLTILSNPADGNADWLDSTAVGAIATTADGHVLFNGTSAVQQVYGPTRFDSISINGAGINLQQSNEVRKWLGLTNGLAYLQNSTDSIYVSNGSANAVFYNTDSINTTSWVHGKLSRKANSNAAYFFPVGKIKNLQSLYAPVRMEKTNSNDVTYSIQYFPDQPVDRLSTNASIHHISELEYWTITSHNFSALPDADAYVSLSWRTYSQVGPTPAIRDSLIVAHYYFDGSNLLWQPELNFTLPNIVNGDVNFGFVRTNKTVADFSMHHQNFTLGTRTFANALPVHISSLYAKADGCAIDVIFSAETLNGFSAYAIEWLNNNRWIPVAHFSGTQSTPGIFQTKHHFPANGINLYRIKLIGIDGKIHYSQVVSAKPQCFENMIKVYPVPFTGQFTVSGLSGKNQLQLVSSNGQTIYTGTTDKQIQEIAVQNLPAGAYLLIITGSNGNRKSFKLIKQ